MLNPDGVSVKGCSYIYAPAGQAGEYAPLAANPYRGCGHECAYCLRGDTLIQMADGASVPIASVRVGDSVIGVTLDRTKRAWGTRITTATILAKIESRKPAYRVTLQDGTEVVCSADHRWLTERGWKYTALDGQVRPALTANNEIRKLSNAILTPPETPSYRLGYIAGMIEGDGSIGIYDYSHKQRPSGKRIGVQHRFRLALKDLNGLERTKRYLSLEGIETRDFQFSAATANRAAMSAIGTTSPARVAKIKALTIPIKSQEWMRGWLAGIFDAEGSYSGALRIFNSDPRILEITEKALSAFNFQSIREDKGKVKVIRLLGGRNEQLRFWQLCNPAISRKFSISGKALCDGSKVVSVELIGEDVPMYDIMTTTENFVANGMISHNCYVPRVLKIDRQEFDAGAVERPGFLAAVTKDAMKYQAHGITEQVMLSFTTDPYHRGDTSLTTKTILTLQEYGLGICTLTKGGTRALRDLSLFRPSRDAFACTLTTLDDSFSRKWEQSAALPADRIAALRAFHEVGIFTWVSLEPTLNCDSSLQIVEATHRFVDLYKIGRANYLPMTMTTDWREYTLRMIALCQRLCVAHYIKRDLQPYLPDGYPNPRRVPQHH